MDRKRILKGASLLALSLGLVAARPLVQGWPKDQTIHYVLGDGAAKVTEIDARWAARDAVKGGDASGDDWAREATFRYAPGQAPRVVTHTPRLADGPYTVEIELAAGGARRTLTRAVDLQGGSTSIDVADAVPR